MNDIIVLAKIKFDLRDTDEAYFAQHEIEAVLGGKVEPIKTIPALFKNYPFNKLDDSIIHIITRHLYLGEIQGYLAKVSSVNVNNLLFRPAFFKEIYLIFETSKKETKIEQIMYLPNKNLCQIFKTNLDNCNKDIFVVRLFPIQTLFEYVSDVKKLPACAITPKTTKNWNEYFLEKEDNINKGLNEMLEHLRTNSFRAPHLGLGKTHIGDFIDWASTELRKPFLHYLHKYKGKGDPRISRALINLLQINEGDTILDPFAGSGAFIADAPTMGLNAIGVEILKIGNLISEVKCNLNYDIQNLRNEIVNIFSNINYNGYSLFSENIENELKEIKTEMGKLTKENILYRNILPHLQKIIYLKRKIEEVQNEKTKKFLLVLLSQKIIEFSEKKTSNNFICSFLNYVEDRYLALYATLKLANKLNVNVDDERVKIINADSTNMNFINDNSIDGILTSPPYFDALDYIGNNMISIIILGFVDDLHFGSTKEYYSKFKEYNLELPQSCINLVDILKKSRRAIKAQIVENYLKMMKLSFRECYRVLKPEKFYAVVVSKYHTWVVNGREQKLETSKILADLGCSEGFKLKTVIQHGLSKADEGKINVEDILLFQK